MSQPRDANCSCAACSAADTLSSLNDNQLLHVRNLHNLAQRILSVLQEVGQDESAGGVFSTLVKEKGRIESFLLRPIREIAPDGRNDRVRHLRCGKKVPKGKEMEMHFARVLSERSFAIEYAEWQRSRFQRSLLDDMVAGTHKLHGKQKTGARFSDFLSYYNISENDRTVVSSAIQIGTKLLTVENWLGRTMNKDSAGVSALLGFAHRAFKRLPYERMDNLVQSMSNSKCPISRLAEAATEKILEAQAYYDSQQTASLETTACGPLPTSESPSGQLMMLLFSFQSSNIPISILSRGFSSQSRWDNCGEQKKIRASEAGVDRKLELLFGDYRQMLEAVHELQGHGLVDVAIWSQSISVNEQARDFFLQSITQKGIEYWRDQSIAVICHAYPRGEALDDCYRASAFMFSEHLQRVIKQFPNTLDVLKLAKTSLSAMGVDEFVKVFGFDTVRNVLRQTPLCYLHTWLARIEIIRLEDIDYDVLFDRTRQFSEYREDNPTCPRMNAQFGRLCVAYAERLLRSSRTDDAEAVLLAWKPLNRSASRLEIAAQGYINLAKAKIYQFSGKINEAFEAAQHAQPALATRPAIMQRYVRVIVNVQLCCQQANEARQTLETHQSRYSSSLTKMEWHQRMAEVEMLEGRFPEARNRLTQILNLYEKEPDVFRQDGYVCCILGIARTFHLEGQLDKAWDHWQSLRSFLIQNNWKNGATTTLVAMSLAHILALKGRWQESRKEWEITQQGYLMFWTPGMLVWSQWLLKKPELTRQDYLKGVLEF
ncbi:MAG: hypothetical protein M1822_008845 [Bathelium mastoideum]|nr:MAG: hypothetical protein M1822_008845 [Bathelium mastoideum]